VDTGATGAQNGGRNSACAGAIDAASVVGRPLSATVATDGKRSGNKHTPDQDSPARSGREPQSVRVATRDLPMVELSVVTGASTHEAAGGSAAVRPSSATGT